MKRVALIILLLTVFAAGQTREARVLEIKIEARVADGSFVISIDGVRYRAFNERQMQVIVATSRERDYLRTELIRCSEAYRRRYESE